MALLQGQRLLPSDRMEEKKEEEKNEDIEIRAHIIKIKLTSRGRYFVFYTFSSEWRGISNIGTGCGLGERSE